MRSLKAQRKVVFAPFSGKVDSQGTNATRPQAPQISRREAQAFSNKFDKSEASKPKTAQ